MTKTGGNGWPEIARAALWPSLVLVATLMFRTEIARILNGSGGAEQIELGPLKVKFTPEAARKLPPASIEVASTVSKLGSDEIDALLSHGEGVGTPICRISGLIGQNAPSFRVQYARYEHFIELGMINLSEDSRNEFEWCDKASLKLAYLSDLGKQTRTYLLKILNSSISISGK